jgi:hypothetical protein
VASGNTGSLIKMAAGHSKTPLVQKLGLKPGFEIVLLNAPDGYEATLGPLPDGVIVRSTLEAPLDLIQFFTQEQAVLFAEFAVLKQSLKPDGALWVSWPKKSARVPTDLDENVLREIGLRHGLVDVKVCAVDAVWSALKFVYRIEDRR